jgi:hypothetical protein
VDSSWRQCTLSLSTPRSWVSRQPQHVIASAPALLARFSSCRLFPFRCSWKVAVFTPLPKSSANRRLPHTRDHKITTITTPDINTAMSLGILPSRLKVTIVASATLCRLLLARYRANQETFWYTLMH